METSLDFDAVGVAEVDPGLGAGRVHEPELDRAALIGAHGVLQHVVAVAPHDARLAGV